MDSLRTHADLVRDLLEIAISTEWETTYERCGRGCCGEWKTRCPSCGQDEESEADGYRTHKPGCRRAALILEAEAFLNVEEELNQEKS